MIARARQKTRFGVVIAAAAAAALSAVAPLAVGSPAADFGPLPPANPFLAAGHGATMHGDAGSSKAFPYAGPGEQSRDHGVSLGHACPTVLYGSDSMVVALCTGMLSRTPRVYLIDRTRGSTLASLALAKGSLLGGVYAYLDERDHLVLVDGQARLLRIAHQRSGAGQWRLSVVESVDLAPALRPGDAVTALMPDRQGRVWFASGAGTVGTLAQDGTIRTLALPDGERIANSISTSAHGTAVTSDHALYLIGTDPTGAPVVRWRQAYERGPGRKPGQLSWGSGATPAFFGPATGEEYVVVTDNAAPRINIEVRRAADGTPVCRIPVFTDRPASGSENGPIAAGRSVFLVDTYGYRYPALPKDAGPSVPAQAPFTGGMTRIDVAPDGGGCHTVWTSRARSAALPKLSTTERVLYTVEQTGDGVLRQYALARVAADSGAVLSRRSFGGALQDPLQMSGTVTADGTFWQGTISGFHHARPLAR